MPHKDPEKRKENSLLNLAKHRADPAWREKRRRWEIEYEKKPEVKAKRKAYRDINKEKEKTCNKARYEANKEKVRITQRNRKYGVSNEHYLKMVAKQGGKCAFTACLETKLDTDHCHKTGTFRGLLCRRHNLLLGHARDSLVDLTDAIQYLSPSGAVASEAE